MAAAACAVSDKTCAGRVIKFALALERGPMEGNLHMQGVIRTTLLTARLFTNFAKVSIFGNLQSVPKGECRHRRLLTVARRRCPCLLCARHFC